MCDECGCIEEPVEIELNEILEELGNEYNDNYGEEE